MFAIVFALANGPLIWAMVVYRNSLVFHNTDKVTSTYIHLLPALLSYRWNIIRLQLFFFRNHSNVYHKIILQQRLRISFPENWALSVFSNLTSITYHFIDMVTVILD